MRKLLPHLIAGFVRFLRLTCRARPINDPRQALRDAGQPIIYATMHAHQVPLIILGEAGCVALVSRSKDGDLITPALEAAKIIPLRGSSGHSKKGGASALRALMETLQAGTNVCLTVDGPTGPRGIVNPGVAILSMKTGAPIVPLVFSMKHRKVLRSWDRTQIPFPFQTITGTFGDPMYHEADESLRDFLDRVQGTLHELEMQTDPEEARHSQLPERHEPLRRAA